MKLLLTSAALVAGILFTSAGCSNPTAAQPAKGDKAASSRGSVVERVTAGPPQRKTLELTTTQPGRIEAYEEAPLYSKLAGYVDAVLVDIGDSVKKGDSLVKLSLPEMEDEVEQKSALVVQAEAEIRQSEAAVKAAQATLATAKARVAQAQAGVTRAGGEYERAKAEHARIQQLAANGSVTQKLEAEALNQFRAAEAAQQEAAAQVDSAEAALVEGEANVEKAVADQGAAAARLKVAQADLARAKTMLAYGEIKAPFDGVVTTRNVDTGHYVQPAAGGMKPLLTIARHDQVRVFVDVPEMEAPLVDAGEEGDAATVTVPSLAGRQFTAKVRRTSWSLDPGNRSLRVEVDLPNENGLLRPGMYATVAILLDTQDDVFALPTAAIIREGRDAFCCTVESGKIARKKIDLGLRSGNEVAVQSGLTGAETVVMARAESYTPGQPVEVLEAE